METRCRIPIWRTFGRIQWHWHVIPEPRITLQGAATWWIHCHDSRATCHIAGCSYLTKSMSWSCHIAGCMNSIRHIENRFFHIYFFWFLMQFRLWRSAAFVSSPIHLLRILYRPSTGVFVFPHNLLSAATLPWETVETWISWIGLWLRIFSMLHC